MGVVTRTLLRGPRRMQIRTNLFFSTVLRIDGRVDVLPRSEVVKAALEAARVIRRSTGRPVWIEDIEKPAYVRPSLKRPREQETRR